VTRKVLASVFVACATTVASAFMRAQDERPRLAGLMKALLAPRVSEHTRISRSPAVRLPGSLEAAPPVVPEIVAPGVLSTGDFESHLEFTPDGQTAYFLRSLPNFAFWTIYESHRRNRRWSRPEIAPFSGRYNDADPFISKDGQFLFFMSNRPVNPGDERPKGDTDIWVMQQQPNGTWGPARNLGEPVNSGGNEFYPRAAGDGTLYFGSDRPGGLGGVDIWRCRRDGNGRYLAAENLGPAVNSTSDEYEAYVSADNSFIIAASTRPGGLGQSDFYVSYVRDGGWTPVKNVGAPANSAGKEYGGKISNDGRYFYFSSTRTTVTDSLPRHMTTADYEALLHSPGNGLGDMYRLRVGALGLDADAMRSIRRSSERWARVRSRHSVASAATDR
jgi:WD40-like Beta Propeller Repeat